MDIETDIVDEVDALLELSSKKRSRPFVIQLSDCQFPTLDHLHDHMLVFGLHVTLDIPIDWAAVILILKSLAQILTDHLLKNSNLNRVMTVHAVMVKHDELIMNFSKESSELPISIDIQDYLQILNTHWSTFCNILLYSIQLSKSPDADRMVWLLHDQDPATSFISFFCFVALSKYKPGLSINLNSEAHSVLFKRVMCHFMPSKVKCVSVKQDSSDLDDWVQAFELLPEVFQIERLLFTSKNKPVEKSWMKLETLSGIVCSKFIMS